MLNFSSRPFKQITGLDQLGKTLGKYSISKCIAMPRNLGN